MAEKTVLDKELSSGQIYLGVFGIVFFFMVLIPALTYFGGSEDEPEPVQATTLSTEAIQVKKESDARKAKQAELAAWKLTEELPDRLAEDLDRAERTGQPTKMLEYKLQEAIKRRDEQRARQKSK